MIPYDRKRLGEYLRNTRERAHLTQLQVSETLGYSSPQFISNIERGVSVVPLATLAKMLSMYGQTTDHVLKIILEGQTKYLKEKLKRA